MCLTGGAGGPRGSSPDRPNLLLWLLGLGDWIGPKILEGQVCVWGQVGAGDAVTGWTWHH